LCAVGLSSIVDDAIMARARIVRRPDPARALTSPLGTWFRAPAVFRRRALGRAPVVLVPRDRTWRRIAPGFSTCVEMAGSGLPFHITAERQVDRSGSPQRLAAALAAGQTVYLPQVHEVLPRLARLMVALRVAFFRPLPGVHREECSFLFVVEGTGRPGMGLHHDSDVDAFWLQLEGRRTVTIGPRVPRGTPEELDERSHLRARRAGWRTFDLEPGSLFHLPAWTPHAVVCRQRSLAVTLTWGRGAPRGERAANHKSPLADLLAWDVASGFAQPIPPARPGILWTQIPILGRRGGRARGLRVVAADGEGPHLPAATHSIADQLAFMPWLSPAAARAASLEPLVDAGLLGPRDLPLRIHPDDPAALDGWRFA
jgi:mannose-6-phosphate isomerase-like protein (cupin superfamily)